MTPALQAFIDEHSQRTNRYLRQLLTRAPTGEASQRLSQAMAYSLLDGGKRIRPVLVYAGATAVGEFTELTDQSACALECIHAYSLIHDDLPAMDDDDLRRGKPTCHVAFDEATAILAGDALQALAFDVLSAETGDPATALALVRELARAAGASGMVAGQAIDLAAVNHRLTLQELEHMHRRKTGALIEASVVMGALSAGAQDTGAVSALRQYAAAIGLAFQVQDDLLDVTADTQVLGKRQGADQQRNKPTYVALLGLDEARRKALDLRDQATAALDSFGGRADYLRDIASYIVEREA